MICRSAPVEPAGLRRDALARYPDELGVCARPLVAGCPILDRAPTRDGPGQRGTTTSCSPASTSPPAPLAPRTCGDGEPYRPAGRSPASRGRPPWGDGVTGIPDGIGQLADEEDLRAADRVPAPRSHAATGTASGRRISPDSSMAVRTSSASGI